MSFKIFFAYENINDGNNNTVVHFSPLSCLFSTVPPHKNVFPFLALLAGMC